MTVKVVTSARREVRLEFRPMVKSILHNICEHLRAVDATHKVRFSCDIYSSGKNPFSERMGRWFLTAFIVRNHLGMSGGPAKYVKFHHRTLLFYAKQTGSDWGSGKPLPQSVVNPWRGSPRSLRAPLWWPYGLQQTAFRPSWRVRVLLCGLSCREARRLCGEIRPPRREALQP
jgi:hypothetical protein